MTWLPTFLMSGQDIYDNFQRGQGAEGISSSAAMANELAGRHQERAVRLNLVKSRMESAWHGAAAGAAHRGLGPLVSEHDLSGNALHTAQDLTGRQAGSFGEAKNGVVPVPPAPGEVDPLAVLTNPQVTATYYQQVTEHNEAARHNVAVMNGYTGASQFNTDGQPSTFGELVDDQAGITINPPDTITSDNSPESTRDNGPHSSAPWPGSGGDPGYRPPLGVDPGTRPDTPAGPGTGPGSGSVDTTTPSSVTVTPPLTGPTALPPGTDSGLGQPRPTLGGGIVPGVGVGLPTDGRNSGGGPRGGVVGGGPRGVVGGGPRGLGIGGGPGVGSGESGSAGRAGSGAAAAAGAGRGGVGFGGVPVGAGGRGRGEEDTERKAPAYLEGGDPEELFDTDQLTAPPAIGDEDD